MQGTHREFHVFVLDHHRDLDFRGGDHLQVDVFLRQGFEHLACDAHVRAHADADDRDLGDLVVAGDLACAGGCSIGLDDVHGLGEVVAVHGEGEVGSVRVADVLQDQVNIDINIGHRAENLVGDAGLVGHADHGGGGGGAGGRGAGGGGRGRGV